MLKTLRRAAFLAAGLLAAIASATSDAQTYPFNSPVYQPSAILSAQTLTATGATVYTVNGLGTVDVTVSGTYTGLTGAFQVTPSRGASPVWTTVNAIPVGAAPTSKPTSSISANGTYRLNVLGYAQVRFNVTALSTGSVTTEWSGGPGFFHNPANVDLGALITNTAQTAATVTSPDQSGAEVTSVICTFNQTANTSGNTTFSIQNKDAASGLYVTLVTSSAITTANNAPVSIAAGRGVQASANVSSSLPIAATWRVSETASGTSTTGTVGCVAN